MTIQRAQSSFANTPLGSLPCNSQIKQRRWGLGLLNQAHHQGVGRVLCLPLLCPGTPAPKWGLRGSLGAPGLASLQVTTAAGPPWSGGSRVLENRRCPRLPSGNPASVPCMSSLCLSFPICLVGALVGSNQATPIERLSWGLNLCLWRLVLLLWPPTSRYWMGILCLVACDWARGWISAACCPFFFRMPPRAVSTVQPCFFRSSEPFISSSDFRFLNLSNLSRVSG